MPGRLRCDTLDLTSPDIVRQLITVLTMIGQDPLHTHALEVSKRYYFRVPDGPLPSGPGWYVIRSKGQSLYVGTAENLDNRLNSENGTRDQFANPQRISDPERNFIKAFHDLDMIGPLTVVVIEESLLREALGFSCELTKRDRQNVEKILNLFRESVLPAQADTT